VVGGPFSFERMTPPPGSAPDDWSWPAESPGPFADASDDAPQVTWLADVPDGASEVTWLAAEPGEEPVEEVVGDEVVAVVDGLVPELVDEEAVVVVLPADVVELPEEGAVVVAEPSPGVEPAGAGVGPSG
jgi:uncharacterized cupin superfamily protein